LVFARPCAINPLQERARAAQAAQQAEACARERRLAALRALVAPDVPLDPARAMQPTEAWVSRGEAMEREREAAAEAAAAEAAGGSSASGAGGGPCAVQPFRPVHGFTAEQVFADHRARVMEALVQAGGLHATAAGRAAIAGAQPATAPRRDALTTQQQQQQQQ
jgi:hypothetical protein